MAVPNSEAVQWLSSGSTSAESRSGRIGRIILEAKQTGERSAGNPHAAFDEAGAGNVVWPRWCDTRRRKSEPTGNTNFGLNRRASPRPYLWGMGAATPPSTRRISLILADSGKIAPKNPTIQIASAQIPCSLKKQGYLRAEARHRSSPRREDRTVGARTLGRGLNAGDPAGA